MIQNDIELKATQQRIIQFQNWVAQFRITTSQKEFPLMAGAYLAEIEKMHAEAMEYLSHHSEEQLQAKAA
jgi:hypothetical protein